MYIQIVMKIKNTLPNILKKNDSMNTVKNSFYVYSYILRKLHKKKDTRPHLINWGKLEDINGLLKYKYM